MSDLELNLQKAIHDALTASAELVAVVGARVFDQMPPPSTGDASSLYPCVTIGEVQVIQDDADCIEGFEVFVTLQAWSRQTGFPQVKSLAAAVRRVLHDRKVVAGSLVEQTLAVSGFRTLVFEHRDTTFRREADGWTSRAIMTFHGLFETVLTA